MLQKSMQADFQPNLTDRLIELHRHPELSGQEFETTARVRAWLTEAGVEILPTGLPTGLIALSAE